METHGVEKGRGFGLASRFVLLAAAIALAAGLALATTPQQAQATEYTSGRYTYTVSSGVATITDYSGSATTLTVPDTLGGYAVLYIDDDAFADCTTITSVTFPDTLQKIESSAFEGCTNLTSVTLPESLSYLGGYAFANCTRLASLTVNSASLECDDYYGAFQNAGILGSGISVTFGSTCTLVPSALLYTRDSSEAPYVTSVSMSSSVQSVGDSAFINLTYLTSVDFGSSITYIDDDAFKNCTNLASISLPAALQTIESSAFEGCTNLTSVTLPKKLSYLGGYAFANCTRLASLTVNSASLECDDYYGAFQNAGILGSGISVTFGSKCTTVPAALLYTRDSSEAPNVATITIPYTVTSIGNNAFGSLTGYTLAGYKGTAGWTYYKANKSDDDITWKKLGTVMSYCSVKLSTTSFTYSGKAKTPGVTVKCGSTKLTKGTHYTVTFASGRKAIGKYKVTIKGVNSAGYYGSVTKYFKIKPGKVSLKSASGGKSKLTVKWNKKSGGVKYQIAYRYKYTKWGRTYHGSWNYVTVSSSTYSKVIKSLSSSYKYQVKVRAYKKVNGTTYYGSWSGTKTVSIK